MWFFRQQFSYSLELYSIGYKRVHVLWGYLTPVIGITQFTYYLYVAICVDSFLPVFRLFRMSLTRRASQWFRFTSAWITVAFLAKPNVRISFASFLEISIKTNSTGVCPFFCLFSRAILIWYGTSWVSTQGLDNTTMVWPADLTSLWKKSVFGFYSCVGPSSVTQTMFIHYIHSTNVVSTEETPGGTGEAPGLVFLCVSEVLNIVR